MMTGSEVTATRIRTDAFIATLRTAVNEAISDLDPHSPCIDDARAALKRIAATLVDVPYVTFANLANIDEAMKRRTGTGLMRVLELQLRLVGAGPELDFESATALLAQFEPMIDLARKQKIN